MNTAKTFFHIVTSYLLGSTVALMVAGVVAHARPTLFATLGLPGVSAELAYAKTFDLVDFIATIVLTSVLVLINGWLIPRLRSRSRDITVADWILLALSLGIFLQFRFVDSSKIYIAAIIVGIEVLYILLTQFGSRPASVVLEKIRSLSHDEMLFGILSGILIGFYLMLVTLRFVTIPFISLSFFIFVPALLVFGLAVGGTKIHKLILTAPAILALLAVFSPTNLVGLAILGLLIMVAWTTSYLFNWQPLARWRGSLFLLAIAVLLMVAYNPTFFVGSFDSVEEGFWLGWLQHLSLGQVPYRDFAMYHTPLLLWGMNGLSQITGYGIYTERLFFHTMQLVGVVIYFIFVTKIVKKPSAIALTMLLFLTFTTTSLRNNSEIRLGVGLLSLLFVFQYFKTQKLVYTFLAGIASAIAVLVSIDVGLVSITAAISAPVIFGGDKLFSRRNLFASLSVIGGFSAVLIPFAVSLSTQGALQSFIEQTTFYAKAFSQGYFNIAIERAVMLSYFHWHIFNEYISSHAFMWEACRVVILGLLIWYGLKWITRKPFSLSEKCIATTAVFGLLLFRVVLGRSDIFHLLFVLCVVFVLIAVLLEHLARRSIVAAALVWLFMLFIVVRILLVSAYAESLVMKFQTYGRVTGTYYTFDFDRGRNAPQEYEIPTYSTNDIVAEITQRTTPTDTIFTFPWAPELYFFTNRQNATAIDTSYAFFTIKDQDNMVKSLETNKPTYVVYQNKSFGGLQPIDLQIVNGYIGTHYKEIKRFDTYVLLQRNPGL